MNFVEIQKTEVDKINQIWTQHAATFPPEERRDEQQFYQLWENPEVEVFGIFSVEEWVGYVVCWPLKTGLFLEHFEIFSSYRNGKLGAEVLQHLTQAHSPVILETEPPHLSEMAARRVAFYVGNGFQTVDENYLQPAYDATKTPQPMWLMASLPVADVAGVQQEIFQTVYGLTASDAADAHFRNTGCAARPSFQTGPDLTAGPARISALLCNQV